MMLYSFWKEEKYIFILQGNLLWKSKMD